MKNGTTQKNSDDEHVRYVPTSEFTDCYLVNTSGAIVKSKTAAKDGDDWYFYVNGKDIKMYTNNKTLTKTELEGNAWKDGTVE